MSLVDIDDYECEGCDKIIHSTLNIKKMEYSPTRCVSCQEKMKKEWINKED